MASILPPIPRFVFTILEPFSLTIAPIMIVLDQNKFVASQLLTTSTNMELYKLTATNQILVLQLANMFGVIGLIGLLVLYTTTEPKVVHRFLFACAVGDLGHLAALVKVMGIRDATNVGAWNDLMWGSIGFTILIFSIRISYLLGFLGEDRPSLRESHGQKRR